MKRIALLLFCLILLAGCAAETVPTTPATSVPTTLPEDPTFESVEPATSVPVPTEIPTEPERNLLEELIENMTLEEKIGQVLLARCPDQDAAGEIERYHLGGIVLFGRDFDDRTADEVRGNIAAYQASASLPLLVAVDEEGGTVCRVSGRAGFRAARFPAPRKLYREKSLVELMDMEEEKCALLSGLGINVNLAPVCDITTDSRSFMYDRSLGLPPNETAMVIRAMVTVMKQNNMGCALKHFPGYGENGDTHTGIAVDQREMEAFRESDFLPFTAGIKAGAGAVLVSHNTVLCMDETYPASLSPEVHRILREELGFDGVAVTDDLSMSAISGVYGGEDAVILALNAGNDLLCCSDYQTAFNAIAKGIEDGRISLERLDEAVARVLRWKAELGLLAQVEN